MFVARTVAVVVSLLALGAPGHAQVEITHTYPFTQSRAVVTEKLGSNPAVIYEGAGSGVFVLDGTNLEPQLKGGVANKLRASGMVRDVCLTSDHLYVAVHRSGITRFDRAETSPLKQWVFPDVADAWAINVPVRIGGNDLVFVGTNDEYDHRDGKSGGRLYMLSANTGENPDLPNLIDEVSLDAPIFSIASMVQGNVVTVLVGTACRQPTSGTYASLLRYDFDISSGLPTSFPTPATWNPVVSGSTVPTFIRDIIIDPTTSPPVAYAAAYTRGVFKVNVASGMNGGLSTASGSWPITNPGKRYFDSLALHDGSLGKILVVGMGPSFRVETTEWGECTYFEPCDTATGTERFGITLYDVSGTNPSAVGSLISDALQPLGLSAYVRSGSLVIAASAHQEGLVIVQATPSSGGFTLTKAGAWDTFGDDIPTGQFDDLLLMGNNAFVGFEEGLAAFDITPDGGGGPPSNLFAEPADVAYGGAVTLAGCPAEAGFPAMIFAANLGSVFIYTASGDGPTIELQDGLQTIVNPDGVRTYSVGAIPPSETPDGFPWLITINTLDVTNPTESLCSRPGTNGSVRIYRVYLEEGQITLMELGGYRPNPCTESSGALFGFASFVSGGDVCLFVGYTPRTLTFADEPDAGLLELHVVYDAHDGGQQDDGVDVTLVGKAPAFEDCGEEVTSNPGMMSYGVGHGLIAATFGCHGIATFSIGDLSGGPELHSAWSDSGPFPTSFLDCDNGSSGSVYATGLDGRIWIFDPLNMNAGPLDTFETQDLAAFISPAPSTESGAPPPPAFYITDFRGGLHRIQCLTNP